MKKIIMNILFAATVFLFASCGEWTDPESLEVKTPSFEEQNPVLYAEYIASLNNYKARPHKITIVTFENTETISGQINLLTSLPDSIDYISLINPDKLHPETIREMDEVRKKGTKVIYDVDFAVLDNEWTAMQIADKEGKLTEEDAVKHFVDRTKEMLSLCDNYGYDGITFSYAGRSHVSLTEPEKVIYTGRQNAFFNTVAAWHESHERKFLAFIGNAQYLFDEAKTLLEMCDYIILATNMAKNADEFSVRAQLAVKSGNVPSDRFIANVQTTQPDDPDQLYGYFGTLDENGNKIRAIFGAAEWVKMSSPDITRAGLLIHNAHYDYYDSSLNYRYIREAIGIMNPSPKN